EPRFHVGSPAQLVDDAVTKARALDERPGRVGRARDDWRGCHDEEDAQLAQRNQGFVVRKRSERICKRSVKGRPMTAVSVYERSAMLERLDHRRCALDVDAERQVHDGATRRLTTKPLTDLG